MFSYVQVVLVDSFANFLANLALIITLALALADHDRSDRSITGTIVIHKKISDMLSSRSNAAKDTFAPWALLNLNQALHHQPTMPRSPVHP